MKVKRPDIIQSQCDKAFSKLTGQGWGYNGDTTYKLCNINEFKLLEKIVQDNPDRKVFKILDVGAGDFTFGDTLVKLLNASKNISEDMRCEILSVRGELNMENLQGKSEVTGKCSHNKIGFFKIENVKDQLEEYYDKDALNSYDLIVSRWTLRHLVDPVKTFSELYELLKEGGIYLGDGFLYSLEHNDENVKFHENMYRIFDYLEEGGNSVLTFGYQATRSMDHFMLRREKDATFEIPFEYEKVIDGMKDYGIASGMMIKFNDLDERNFNQKNFKKTVLNCYQGSQELYKITQEVKSEFMNFEYLGALPKLLCSSEQFEENEVVHNKDIFESYISESNSTVEQMGVDALSENTSTDHFI